MVSALVWLLLWPWGIPERSVSNTLLRAAVSQSSIAEPGASFSKARRIRNSQPQMSHLEHFNDDSLAAPTPEKGIKANPGSCRPRRRRRHALESKWIFFGVYLGPNTKSTSEPPNPEVRCQKCPQQSSSESRPKVAVEEPARCTDYDGGSRADPNPSELFTLSPGASAE